VYQKSHCSPPGRYFKIDEMTPDDLKEVLEIEQISFPTPWSENIFLSELYSELSRIFLAKSVPLKNKKFWATSAFGLSREKFTF